MPSPRGPLPMHPSVYTHLGATRQVNITQLTDLLCRDSVWAVLLFFAPRERGCSLSHGQCYRAPLFQHRTEIGNRGLRKHISGEFFTEDRRQTCYTMPKVRPRSPATGCFKPTLLPRFKFCRPRHSHAPTLREGLAKLLASEVVRAL